MLPRLLLLPALLLLPLTLQAQAPLADGEFTIGPDYTPCPELTPQPNTPKGTVTDFTLDSAQSKFYPGINGHYLRKVWVYIPSGYKPGTPTPFIVVQDGGGYRARLVPVLDNLIAAKQIPPIVAVMVNPGGGDSRGSERGLEYDTLSPTYTQFIETEVLPKIATDYKVTFTADPEGRATMGGSSGASCAFTMAWYRPDLYHRVLSYSGTYVNQQWPADPATPHGAWEYHEQLIPNNPAKPIRIWMEAGEHDNGWQLPEDTYHNWVTANQRMAAALKAKGYHYQYYFAKNAGHTDPKAAAQTLAEALTWLWQGYSAK
jgi:iron(III)-enterobactin esterase